MIEEWKDIPGYEGLYQVSSFGNVKSLRSNKILKPQLNKGYYHIGLCVNNIKKTHPIHKLVAITFHNHIPNGHNIVVNHIDRNKLNNYANNLNLVDSRYNSTEYRENPGVSFNNEKKQYSVIAYIKNDRVFLGYYVDLDLANDIYQKAIKNIDKYNGDRRSFLNFINPNYYSKRGAYYDKSKDRYISSIRINRKLIIFGAFKDENWARLIYNRAHELKDKFNGDSEEFKKLVLSKF